MPYLTLVQIFSLGNDFPLHFYSAAMYSFHFIGYMFHSWSLLFILNHTEVNYFFN